MIIFPIFVIMLVFFVITYKECYQTASYQWITCESKGFIIKEDLFQGAKGIANYSTPFCNFKDQVVFECHDPVSYQDCLHDGALKYNTSTNWSCATQDPPNCFDIPTTSPSSSKQSACTDFTWLLVFLIIYFPVAFGQCFCCWRAYYRVKCLGRNDLLEEIRNDVE
jgi:hypothetical protein